MSCVYVVERTSRKCDSFWLQPANGNTPCTHPTYEWLPQKSSWVKSFPTTYLPFPTHAQRIRQVVRFPARKSKVIFNNVEENEHYLKAAAAAAKVPSGFSSLQDELLVPSTANYRHHHIASPSDVVVGFLWIRHPLSRQQSNQHPERVTLLLLLPRWRSLWPQAIFIYETKNSPFLFRRPTSGKFVHAKACI